MNTQASTGVRPPDSCPGFLRPAARRSWAELGGFTGTPGATFDPDSVDGLPSPVARWLRHAIAAGTPLRRGAQVAMHGDIRIGKWRPFTAQQIVAPNGYLWAAKAGRFPMKVRGFDRYSALTGQMSWRLFGLIPVVTTTGADVSRSAAGRLAGEIIGLTPACALGPNVAWDAIDDHQATATITVDDLAHHVTIDVADDGALRTVSLPRWGNPDKGRFKLHTFGVICDGEFTADGYTLPGRIKAGWWLGTPEWEQGEFFRATIDQARFF